MNRTKSRNLQKSGNLANTTTNERLYVVKRDAVIDSFDESEAPTKLAQIVDRENMLVIRGISGRLTQEVRADFSTGDVTRQRELPLVGKGRSRTKAAGAHKGGWPKGKPRTPQNQAVAQNGTLSQHAHN